MDDTSGLEKNPNLEIAHMAYLLQAPVEVTPAKDKPALQKKFLDAVKANNMAPYYIEVASSVGLPVDNTFLGVMQKANKDKVKALDAQRADAEENLGESEVREALLEKAQHYSRIGSKDEAVDAYQATLEKTVGVGQKLDIVLSLIRIGLFHGDRRLTSESIDWAKELLEEGGDWERKNRLKVYEATYLMSIRNFQGASGLFLDSLATFTSYELFSYSKFVYYAVLMGIKCLDRVSLKKRVLNSPEVLSVIHESLGLRELSENLYNCDYKAFMGALSVVSENLRSDLYLGQHAHFYTREMRISAYSQFLESYRSVTLDSMAVSFGLSVPFLDTELSRFIASGRLNCKIDKVVGVVETNRPDARNAQYQAMIKHGDQLLNRIQKLSRVINV